MVDKITDLKHKAAHTECKFEVVMRLPPGLPAGASALAQRALEVGLKSVNDQMQEAYGECFDIVSIKEIVPTNRPSE